MDDRMLGAYSLIILILYMIALLVILAAPRGGRMKYKVLGMIMLLIFTVILYFGLMINYGR